MPFLIPLNVCCNLLLKFVMIGKRTQVVMCSKMRIVWLCLIANGCRIQKQEKARLESKSKKIGILINENAKMRSELLEMENGLVCLKSFLFFVSLYFLDFPYLSIFHRECMYEETTKKLKT